MMFELFCHLCEWFAQDESAEGVFCHCFLVLMWNLMRHVDNTARIHTRHMMWENDSLIIDFTHQKNDQTGEQMYPHHIYANPYKPEICPCTTLGKYFAMFLSVIAEGGMLFPGAGQSKWFANTFRKLLRYKEEHGGWIGQMGYHLSALVHRA